jgi:hypothetical protein
LRVIDLAEEQDLAPHLFAPTPGRMRGKREILVGLGGLVMALMTLTDRISHGNAPEKHCPASGTFPASPGAFLTTERLAVVKTVVMSETKSNKNNGKIKEK